MTLPLQYFQLWLLKFFTFLLGCMSCFYFQAQLGMTPVMGAALTGLLGTFIPETKRIEKTHVHANIYMGAFVAMGSKITDQGFWQIFFVSAIGSLIYFVMSRYFKGMGGRLGLIAFISSLLGLALKVMV
ncbi:hypothetical protein ACLSU7_05860 [Bdellovibrio sp. HCB185ZH]|uniref:hypothetical protein n=1 Tax=Bdellovibrio sp. HCB185ZH TaxID=3394235 RepID=UPI0039A59D9A